ncbi:DNA polymerase III subunit gamma/tau [Candidatus Dojkabacteria bacterium]|uniref:DNA polymerase III subunit gamma/tau n=1 Tax=Candidatus Dojkabacteria bacterium TaxID=2099670 RepID=A0A955L3H6_9BACT|nr:DNA polymerase III subunit gamma/tau [Candidatus Dojkabacteria bacterium]
MSTVLYRKYRSTKFSEILGQDHITSILKEAVRSGTTAHSYLFYGPRGTGKTSTARVLAKALNCPNMKGGEPCNKCKTCESITKLKYLDLIEIDAASNRGIEQIRELKERINFSPSEGKYKIYIIDEVHMLTTEAFNALLKTLEEPPEFTVFILATTDIHKVPSTILSRCQRFDFKLASNNSIRLKLQKIADKEKIEVDDKALDLIIRSSKGSFRDGETIFEKIITDKKIAADKKISVEEVKTILGLIDEDTINSVFEYIKNKDIKASYELVESISAEGQDLYQFILQIIEKAREETNSIIMDGKDSFGITIADYMHIIKLFTNARVELKTSAISQLPIEMALTELILFNGELPELSHSDKIEKQSVVKKIANIVKKKDPETEEVKLEKEVSKNVSNGVVSLKELREKWDKFLKEIKPFNHNLAAFLMYAELSGIQDEEVEILVPFKIHKKKIEQKRSKDILSEISKKIYGNELTYSCIVDKAVLSRKQKQRKNKDEVVMVDAMKEVFGDMIVEDS